MSFKSNTSKAQENDTLKPEGVYEVVIEKVTRKTTPNGAQSLGLTYVIRNDVEQKYKNGKIFHDVWKKREPNPDDEMAEGYNYAQLMAIAEAAGLPGEQDYDSFDAFLAALVDRPVKVELYHDTWNEKTREKIRSHRRTAFPDIKHVMKQPATAGGFVVPQATEYAADVPPMPTDNDYPF